MAGAFCWKGQVLREAHASRITTNICMTGSHQCYASPDQSSASLDQGRAANQTPEKITQQPYTLIRPRPSPLSFSLSLSLSVSLRPARRASRIPKSRMSQDWYMTETATRQTDQIFKNITSINYFHSKSFLSKTLGPKISQARLGTCGTLRKHDFYNMQGSRSHLWPSIPGSKQAPDHADQSNTA